jgi:hypothetical protein
MNQVEEWNKLAIANTEIAIVSSMYEAVLKSSEHIETFSTWVLVSTAAVASFFLANAEGIVPYIGNNEFRICGLFLLISCLFGLFEKVFALRCKIALRASKAVKKTFNAHIKKYELEERKIIESAEIIGASIKTGIDFNRILESFLEPFPFWVKWLSKKHLEKHAENPQISYLSPIKSLNGQGITAFFQVISFMGFFGLAFVFASKL